MSKNKQKPITVVCVKVGTKYDPKYVNVLEAMVKRNLSVPHEFVCITDDPTGVHCRTVVAATSDGWWTKLTIFDANSYEFRGKVLYFDLDVVICANINKLATYDSEFAICRDWLISKYNSSVMLFEAGSQQQIWDNYIKDVDAAKAASRDGDQGHIAKHSNPDVFPERFISSYKVHCKGIADPITPVVLFHGKPDPHEVQDRWVIENWRI